MTFLVLLQNLLGTLILFVDHLQHLVVHDLGSGLRVGTLETVLIIIIIAQVGQLVTHTGVCHHAVSLFRGALQVVHGTRGNLSDEELLGSTATQQGAHLVEHGLLGLQHTLLREIPCSTQGSASGYDGHLDKRIGKLGKPRDGGMSCFVDGYRLLFSFGHHLGLLLQATDDAVNSIEEILLADLLSIVAGSNQGCLVADVGNVGA